MYKARNPKRDLLTFLYSNCNVLSCSVAYFYTNVSLRYLNWSKYTRTSSFPGRSLRQKDITNVFAQKCRKFPFSYDVVWMPNNVVLLIVSEHQDWHGPFETWVHSEDDFVNSKLKSECCYLYIKAKRVEIIRWATNIIKLICGFSCKPQMYAVTGTTLALWCLVMMRQFCLPLNS